MDKQELLEAVNELIVAPDAHDLFEALRDVIPLATRQPILLTGRSAAVNPILRLRVDNVEAYNKVMELVERRRAERGYDALQPAAEPPGYDKTAYMREFMEQKRVRQRRAAEIENMLRPERDKLVGNHRLEFMRQQSLRWKEQLDAHMRKVKDASGGSLTREMDRMHRGQFWAAVDRHLDEKYEAARRESLKPTGKRTSDLGAPLEDLIAALTADPYATR
jgi:hypothetical protein